jgi:hypothetical protein
MFVPAAFLLAGAAFVSYEALVEAYGAGAPYYSRTTNMDKWRNPLPEIVLADLFVAAVAGVLVWAGARKLRKPDQANEHR